MESEGGHGGPSRACAEHGGCQCRAYGKLGSIHDPTMGWGAGGLYVQTFTLNVGCVYVRATARSIELMERVEHRLAAHGVRNFILSPMAVAVHSLTTRLRASRSKLAYTPTALATLPLRTREWRHLNTGRGERSLTRGAHQRAGPHERAR